MWLAPEGWNTQSIPFCVQKFSILDLFNIIASDVPGGNRILIIKIKAQHSALSKAIKNTEFK